MPRGRGDKKHCNLDYSRFSKIDDSDDDEPAPRPKGASPAMPELPSPADANIPQELRDAFNMMRYSKITGDENARQKATELAMKAVEDGGPEVRARFEEVTRKMMEQEEGGAVAAAETAARRTPGEAAGELGNLRDRMKQQLEASQRQMEMLQQQQAQLEGLKSPEDFFRFLSERGFGPEDMQRALSDEEYGREMMERQLEKDAKEVQVVSDDVMQEVEALSGSLRNIMSGNDLKEGEAAASAGRQERRREAEEKRQAEKSESQEESPDAPKIPVHRLQIVEDESTGEVAEIVLNVQLPGVPGMAAVELDVSERHLRLQTTTEPLYMLRVGPFARSVDPDRARAKFSKKKEELVVRLTPVGKA